MGELLTATTTEATSPWGQPESDYETRHNQLSMREAVGDRLKRSERRELAGIRKMSGQVMDSLGIAVAFNESQVDKNKKMIDQIKAGGSFDEDGTFTPIEGWTPEWANNEVKKYQHENDGTQGRSDILQAEHDKHERMSAPLGSKKAEAPVETNPWASAAPLPKPLENPFNL